MSTVMKGTRSASDTEIESTRKAAEKALRDPMNHGEGGPVVTWDENGEEDAKELEFSYDALVPEFFR
tara:strand:- start:54 stop:254 length:201 start_codon:yes stop_codon:yes gene_type:complete